jgi:hypothetical protein
MVRQVTQRTKPVTGSDLVRLRNKLGLNQMQFWSPLGVTSRVVRATSPVEVCLGPSQSCSIACIAEAVCPRSPSPPASKACLISSGDALDRSLDNPWVAFEENACLDHHSFVQEDGNFPRSGPVHEVSARGDNPTRV